MSKTLFGAPSWTPPSWLKFLYSISFAKLGALRRNKPKIFWVGFIALIIISISGGLAWLYYQILPKPTYIEVTIINPDSTSYSTEELLPNPLLIQFSESAARLELIEKKLDKGVTLSPSLSGEWKWTDDKTLMFTPEKDWAANQKYQISLSRSLFPNHVLIKKSDYEFNTPSFGAEITKAEFYQDPTNAQSKTIEATFRFTHPVDIDTFKKNLSVVKESENNKKVQTEPWPFTLSFDKFKREIYVHSANLTPLAKDSFLILTLASDMSATGNFGKLPSDLSKRVLIPSQHNFFHIQSVTSTIVTNKQGNPEQILIIQTTDGVKNEELQKNITAYLLPKDRPASNSAEEMRNYNWPSPSEVTADILALANPIELTAIPSDKEYGKIQSFKYKQPEGRVLYIKINEGLKSFGGYALSSPFTTVAGASKYPREVKITGSGALLALSGERKLSVIARGLDGLRTTLYRIKTDQINNLISQTGGQFSRPYFENYSFNEENISEVFSKNNPLNNEDPGQAQYVTVDFSPYVTSQRGLFFLNVSEWDPNNDIVLSRSDKRLVLLTDLGLIIKDNADNTHDVFVQSLENGSPVANVTIEVLGKNGLPIHTVTTDNNGHATIIDLSGFSHEKSPIVYIAKKDDDLSFIPYDREDRNLSYYQFDISGLELDGSEQLTASLFSDRGIYRPGEKIQTGIIVKSSVWEKRLNDIPLEIVFTNPRGAVIQTQKIRLPESGFIEASYQTDATSPAGIYHVNAYVVKEEESTLMGSTSVRVEDFLPDTLKIKTSFSAQNISGWVSPDALKGIVSLNNLYGTPATERRLQASLTLSPTFPSFPSYAKYTFYNPYKLKEEFTENLPDQKTNDKGEAEFDFQLGRYVQATYQLNFFVEGFASEGGRGVKSEGSVLVSPMSYLVGTQIDSTSKFFKKDSQHTVNLIAINSELKPIDKDKLTIQLIEKKQISVLTGQSDGTFKYQSSIKEVLISSSPLTIPSSGLTHPLVTDQGGDFEIRIFDEAIQVGLINYSVADNTNLSRALDKSSELIMTLDKSEYQPGDDMILSIKAPYAGHGLITLERDNVYAHQWFSSETNSSVQTIHIPENFSGNGYINVSIMRDKNSPEIFMSPLSYAVLPFKISLDKYQEPIELRAPELIKPMEDLTVHYKTARPSKIIIYAVDEGILQFAGYNTPNPLKDFFQKRALEVNTMQTINLILPEYSLFKQVAAVGGDQAYKLIGNNLNPFKRKTDPPVIYWSGIIDADENEKELSFKIPDYFNGSIRIMAVAVAENTIGTSKNITQVRGPLVISPNAPLFVSPGDEFEINLTLANNIVGSGAEAEINLTLIPSPELEVIGANSQKIKVAEATEKPAHFKLKSKTLGNAALLFKATLGDESVQSTTHLSVRALAPYMTRLKQGTLKEGKATVDVSEALYPQYRNLTASLSPLPLSLSKGLLTFLEGYPYGCTEQVVSKTFPALALSGIEGFDISAEKANTLFDKTIHILRSRQNYDGSFMYWPLLASSEDNESTEELTPNENEEIIDEENDETNNDIVEENRNDSATFATIYALHFLTDAIELGYAVPRDMLDRGKEYLISYLKQDITQARLYAYALYILTRRGEVTSNYLANLRDYLEKNNPDNNWKTSIIGAYIATTYKLLQQTDESDTLMNLYKDSSEKNKEFYNSGSANNAQYAYLLAKHFPEELKNLSDRKLQMLLKPLTDNEYTTLSATYAILALQAYSQASKNEMTNAEISEIGKDKKTNKLSLSSGPITVATFTENAQKILFSADSTFPIYYQTLQSGFEINLPTKEIKQGLEIQREYRNNKNEVITQIPVGSDVEVHLKVRTINENKSENVVVVELLPGGFDLMNSEILLAGKSAKPSDNSWNPDYIDAREDRVLFFGTIDKDVKEFVYRLKATNAGTYQTPGIFAESMYNATMMARGVAGKMTVVDR